MPRDVPVSVKICGLSDAEAVAAAVTGGAAMVGFVFFPPSPRAVTPAQVKALAAPLPGDIARVGVFVDPDDTLLDDVFAHVTLDHIQLHGGETPARAQAIASRYGAGIIKAIKVSTAADIAEAARYQDAADRILFDAKAPKGSKLPGGNAQSFDWNLLAGVAPAGSKPWILSGGLDIDNVAEAVKISGATAVDVSSGVESAPGKKDPAKIKAFLKTVARL
jgi:phosphoribosylanthranilate isomerase